jgi:hypothetical protein
MPSPPDVFKAVRRCIALTSPKDRARAVAVLAALDLANDEIAKEVDRTRARQFLSAHQQSESLKPDDD